jgi:threonyl-tRNA synthetase
MSLNTSAASILAAALFELFPGVALSGGGLIPSGFYYDFVFPHSIHPELHLQIEEKMRQIARERREIRVLEMVGVSAREFLKSKGNRERALQIEGNGLFELVEIGSFADLSLGSNVKNSAQLHCFKLFPPIVFDGGMRIWGAAFDQKEDLKLFVKRLQSYSRKRHEKRGEDKLYWRRVGDEYIWLSKGIQAEEELIDLLKKNLYPEAIEIRKEDVEKNLLAELKCDAYREIFSAHREFEPVEEVGFFDSQAGKELQITISLKNAISSLQFIENTLNILCFKHCIRFSDSKRKGGRVLADALKELGKAYEKESQSGFPTVNFLVADGLGRLWSAVTVQVSECLIVRVRVERILALLLEQDKT